MISEAELLDFSKLSAHQTKTMEMEAQVHLLKLEREVNIPIEKSFTELFESLVNAIVFNVCKDHLVHMYYYEKRMSGSIELGNKV